MVSVVLQIAGDETVVYLYNKIFISLSTFSLCHELMKTLG